MTEADEVEVEVEVGGACARCALAAGVAQVSRTRAGKASVVVPPGSTREAVAVALAALKPCDHAALKPCDHAAGDARRARLRAVGLDERTAALALVLAQGDAAPADARALVAELAAGAAKAWG